MCPATSGGLSPSVLKGLALVCRGIEAEMPEQSQMKRWGGVEPQSHQTCGKI